jgi:hypothetical protein
MGVPMPQRLDGACTVAVKAEDALAWLDGRLSDSQLLVLAPLRPEAVFIVNLGCLHEYRQLVRDLRAWWRRGCRTMICRTSNPVVRRHLVKVGCVRTWLEKDGSARYAWPPAAFKAWVDRWRAS